MDDQRIDLITRSLAAGTSRRALLRALFGAAVGGTLGLTGHSAGAAKPAKVPCCHWDKDDGSYRYIEVSENALPVHLAHGDTLYFNCCTDADCGSGEFCVGGGCAAAGQGSPTSSAP